MNGLYALKPWYTARLHRVVDVAVRRGTSPDVFTAAGLAAAALAGALVAAGWWLPALLALALRLAGANLDGAVARARGVARPWGFVLNELGDRGSDVLVMVGLAVLAGRTGSVAALVLVLVATVAATLPTFASLAASGAGATRRNGGPFGKTERCAAVVVATAFPVTLPWVAGVIVLGSLVTAGLRLRATHAELTLTVGVA